MMEAAENAKDRDEEACSPTVSDPPGVFEALEEDCYIFNLEIVSLYFSPKWFQTNYFGENICIKIAVKKAPDAEREASAFKREKFEFFLKEDEGNKVEISLMKGNVKQGEIISTEIISIPSLKQLVKDEKVDRHIDIDEDVVIKVVMSAKVDRLGTKLLLGHRLCDEEKKYIDTRLKSCLRTMAGLLKDNPPAAEIYVPRIAVMGSGGGFRAMTAFSGVMSALVRSEIADMVMYNVGLSGSAWYLSTLYSHPDWPQKKSALDLRSELRKGIVSSSWRILLNPKHWLSVASDYSKSQGFSLTNVYGRIISEKFLQKRKYSTMTNQQEKVKEGSVPLPLYAALNVKRETSAKVFHEWIEFSPFAIGMPKYGTFLQPKLFGSEFFSGRVLKEFDEFPLHFLLGIWGSAYCILLNRFIQTDQAAPNVLEERNFIESEVEKSLESNTDVPEAETAVRGDKSKTKIEMIMEQPFVDKISNDIHGRAAVVNNFMRGLQLQEYRPSTKIRSDGGCFSTIETTDGLYKELHEMNPTDAAKMYLVDAGLAFNSPFPLILRPEREVDLILSFDFSERESDKADPFTELILAAEWAKLHEIPFPDINAPAIGEEGYKECYVFENRNDPTCPIVMHFILVNNKFRKFKSPGVSRETKEETEFSNFNVFDDKTYSTTKFQYSEQAFNRLASLMEFNTLLYKDTIINNIKKCVENRKNRVISKLGKNVSGAGDKK